MVRFSFRSASPVLSTVQLVVALVHQDVHGEREVDQLRRLATTALAPVATAAGPPLCRVVHRKPGGRVTREVSRRLRLAHLASLLYVGPQVATNDDASWCYR